MDFTGQNMNRMMDMETEGRSYLLPNTKELPKDLLHQTATSDLYNSHPMACNIPKRPYYHL